MRRRTGSLTASLVLLLVAPACLAAQPTEKPQIRFQPMGTVGHSWGAFVTPGTAVEDWVPRARPLCGKEELCVVNVFDDPELATHENPVPEANRPGWKWVLTYRHNEKPRIVVKEVHPAPDKEKRTWEFDG